MRYSEYTPEDVVKDYIEMRAEDLRRFEKVYENISSFVSAVLSLSKPIRKNVKYVKCLPVKNCVLVVDPTKRFFSLLRIEKVSNTTPRVLCVSMSPPLIPHFFLVVSYLLLKSNLIPTMLVRSSPIFTLSALLCETDMISASLANIISSLHFLESFARYEISVLPFEMKYLKQPLKPHKEGVLYLCDLGLSSSPVEDSYNVEVDIFNVPPMTDQLLNSQEFKPLNHVLDEIVSDLHE